jgi:hypothetical protein
VWWNGLAPAELRALRDHGELGSDKIFDDVPAAAAAFAATR